MPVPDYQTLMLPLLKLCIDNEEHSLREAIETLGNSFQLTEDERKELLPSGRQAKFDNRVGWARTYLAKAGLLESVGRGRFRITPEGVQAIQNNPSGIGLDYLKQFATFADFQNTVERGSKTLIGMPARSETPEEILEANYTALRQQTAQDLLEKIRQLSPRFFERLVVDLLLAMGYGGSRKDAGEAIGQSGDGGIDGIIKEDRLGLDAVYIQAKRWDNVVGRPVVQAFVGSLAGQKARKGVIITTSAFSSEAKQYVQYIGERIILIDGEQLAQFLMDFNVGVIDVSSYVVKKVDLDYFSE